MSVDNKGIRSVDPNIGHKIQIVRREKRVAQAKVASHLHTVRGRARSARWLSSVENGNGVIYEDEVEALEEFFGVAFAEVQVSLPESVLHPDHSQVETQVLITEVRDYFRIQQAQLDLGDYELWFSNPPSLLLLNDENIRNEVALNMEKGIDYKFVWLIGIASKTDFQDFLEALMRVSELLPPAGKDDKIGGFSIFPIEGLSLCSHDDGFSAEYSEVRERLNQDHDHIVFHKIVKSTRFKDPNELHCLAHGSVIEESSVSFFLPVKPMALANPHERALAVLQLKKVGFLRGFDVTAEEKGWLLLDRDNTRRIEAVLRELKDLTSDTSRSKRSSSKGGES